MKFDFGPKMMDIGTFPFNLVRVLALAGTEGAEISECLYAADRVKENNTESWCEEMGALADRVAKQAEQAFQAGEMITARQAYLRASNYYRSAMFSVPETDPRMSQYLRLNREYFHKAAPLCTPAIEPIEIPFEGARLPGYFFSTGQAKRPTLLMINGGDSTNEELAHWLGFAAVARGWNALVFEGPGQWSALQLNPGLYLRFDYELPVKAVIDYLLTREEVDPDKIALYGPSMGAILAGRVAALEKRLCACITSGLLVDVYEAWHAIWPKPLQNAGPRTFDVVFEGIEKIIPQLHNVTNHFSYMMNLTKPHEIIDFWKPWNLTQYAPQIECPMLMIYGEAEAAQSNEKVALNLIHWIKALKCPTTVHMFSFEDGWAATHCQIGAVAPLQALVFDWLDKVVVKKEQMPRLDLGTLFDVMPKYMPNNQSKNELRALADELRAEDAR